MARTLERARTFHVTGEVAAYDRILTTIGAVQPEEVSGRAFTLLAPERARTLFLDPLPEGQRPAPGLVGVQGGDGDGDNPHTAMTRPQLSDIGTPPRASAPAGLRDARVMTLLNGLTVVLVPRRQFPSVTALLGFHGGRAALPPGVLEMVRIVEGPLSRFRHPSTLEISQFDGRGFTADFVRTDRRRLSNALFSLVDRLRIVAETDWQQLLTARRSRRIEPRRRRTTSRRRSRTPRSWPRSTATIRTGGRFGARICCRSIRRWRRSGCPASTARATGLS